MTEVARKLDFAACFDLFDLSAVRVETLRKYSVTGEEDELRAFRLGLPLHERRTSPWLARIRQTTALGKSWRRVRVIGRPLTEYERYEMACYRESAQAGEVILIADRSAHPELAALARDFWLFDAGGPRPIAALLDYDESGYYLGSEVTTEPGVIRRCKAALRLAERYAVPLEGWA